MSSRFLGGSRDDATKIGGDEDGCRTQTRAREREEGEAGVSFSGFGFEQSLSLADLLVLSNGINVYKKRRYSTWGDKQPLSSIASSSTLAKVAVLFHGDAKGPPDFRRWKITESYFSNVTGEEQHNSWKHDALRRGQRHVRGFLVRRRDQHEDGLSSHRERPHRCSALRP